MKPGSYYLVKQLRMEFDKGSPVDLGRFSLHSVGTVLKMFLRELPVPIIPPKMSKYFIAFMNGTSLTKMIRV